jgi:hypothetical protein
VRRLAYPDDASLGDARALYFTANGLGDGHYHDRWVKLMVGPVPLWFPNSPARARAVRLHDLHHVLTAYDTSWTGEAEIGAWEIASGCAHWVAAWVLNLYALAIGLVIAPQLVWRAFVRGRHTRNLYRTEFGDALLARRVGALRGALGLAALDFAPTVVDRLLFAGWGVVSIALALLTAAAPITALWLGVRWLRLPS